MPSVQLESSLPRALFFFFFFLPGSPRCRPLNLSHFLTELPRGLPRGPTTRIANCRSRSRSKSDLEPVRRSPRWQLLRYSAAAKHSPIVSASAISPERAECVLAGEIHDRGHSRLRRSRRLLSLFTRLHRSIPRGDRPSSWQTGWYLSGLVVPRATACAEVAWLSHKQRLRR